MAEERAPVLNVRERTEWTVEDRTNSSFLILDALGGMKRGKVEISKKSIAVLDGYSKVVWNVDFSNGSTETFETREALLSRFNGVDISDPQPSATEVDYSIDISSEASGITRLWLHKEWEGADPEPPAMTASDISDASPRGVAILKHRYGYGLGGVTWPIGWDDVYTQQASGFVSSSKDGPAGQLNMMGINVVHAGNYQWQLVGRQGQMFTRFYEAGVKGEWLRIPTNAAQAVDMIIADKVALAKLKAALA